MTKALFTGGGTAGHVTPNISLIEKCRAAGWEVNYIGSHSGIEKDIIGRTHTRYFAISSGKFRRYFSLQNFIDPVYILLGLIQSYWICRREKPDVLFSKGGFVAVPVVIAAWLNRIPVVIHESDMTPGLANRLSVPFARHVCVTFEKTLQYLKTAQLTGTPVRRNLIEGDAMKGLEFLGFDRSRPVLLACGGSLGAVGINQVVRDALPELLQKFQIVHLCGPDHVDESLQALSGYRQYTYLQEEFGDVLACAEIVINRAGANSIYELQMMHKPSILIPLPAAVSRGDQIVNAREFEALGYSLVIHQDKLDVPALLAAINTIFRERTQYIERMQLQRIENATDEIFSLLSGLVS